MINFITHPSYDKEIAALKPRFQNLAKGIDAFKRLASIQFHPKRPQSIIAPGKLHRLHQNDIWAIWKVEVAVKGVRSNKSPRLWFAIKGSEMVFLCIATHENNYNDEKVKEVAISRVTDFF